MKDSKKGLLPAAVILVLALAAAVGSRSFLGPCVHEDGSFGVCHWAGRALFGVSLLQLSEAAAAVITRDTGVRRGLFLSMFLTGILAMVIPGGLISLCGMATMRCRSLMRPAMLLLFGVMAAVAAAGFLRSGKRT